MNKQCGLENGNGVLIAPVHQSLESALESELTSLQDKKNNLKREQDIIDAQISVLERVMNSVAISRGTSC